MPAQRRARGSYAKYICTNCRKRKIKCDLPEDVEIQVSKDAQPTATSCQRCIAKGLDCVVDSTVLGRPSHPKDTSMTKTRLPSGSALGPPSNEAHHDMARNGGSDGTVIDSQDDFDDYLMVRPERIPDSDQTTTMHQRRRPQPADKFQAMTNPSYLLSTLLQRDVHFASRFAPRMTENFGVKDLVDSTAPYDLDRLLVWHRLFYPDIPRMATLREQLSALDYQDAAYTPVAFLFTILNLLALKAEGDSSSFSQVLKSRVENLVVCFAQRTLLILPEHHYAMLALDLTTEYEPLLLAMDSKLASDAVQARIVPPLLVEMALDLGIDTAPSGLQQQLHSEASLLHSGLLDDCLKCWRLSLRDDVLGGEGRQGEKRHMMGETLDGTMDLLRALLKSDHLPPAYTFAFHSLLCQASKLEYILRVKEDWRVLGNLGRAIDDHKEACQWQRQTLKASLTSLRPREALSVTQLLDMQLHAAYCWTSGSAMFYAVMGGAHAQSSSSSLDIKEALDVSDQIIERFSQSTFHQHASEPHTEFLIKYGSGRMDDLELALLNFVSAMDNLDLEGVSYIPPTRHITTHILYTVKDVMEGQAARMKGWGGLHERAHMHLLLIRDCANSLEAVGSRLTKQTGSEAIAEGCLWASTARLLRSLHKLLVQWKEWNALGQVKVCNPSEVTEHQRSGDGERLARLASDGGDPLPDDLFFDWDLWKSVPA